VSVTDVAFVVRDVPRLEASAARREDAAVRVVMGVVAVIAVKFIIV